MIALDCYKYSLMAILCVYLWPGHVCGTVNVMQLTFFGVLNFLAMCDFSHDLIPMSVSMSVFG